MNNQRRNLIKKLAIQSYSNNNLNKKTTIEIAKSLKRSDLKVYVKKLKTLEAKKTIRVTIPDKIGLDKKKRFFSKIYPDQRIVFDIDPTLLTGIKVTDFDNEYELSLRGMLEHALKGNRND
ncbi:MAG: hypothetical protein ACD_37C00072G0002 [uncultured bacterium]|nr:MAG: hypothetical protein ACD_37C00072G0002 [uncultured bacterium]